MFQTKALPNTLGIHSSLQHTTVYVHNTLKLQLPPTFESGLASDTCHVGGEKRPGIDCLCINDNSKENLGIHLMFEIVSKIIMYVFLYFQLVAVYCQLEKNLQLQESRGYIYEGKDAFLRLPMTFGKLLRYEML